MARGSCGLEIRGERLECSFSGWHAQNEVMGVENVLDESELRVGSQKHGSQSRGTSLEI